MDEEILLFIRCECPVKIRQKTSMPVTRIQATYEHEIWRDWHILTVAEDGFSALMSYACNDLHAHDPGAVIDFVYMVNNRDESGSLHPQVPISVLPRRFFRDIDEIDIESPEHTQEFRNELNGFVTANRRTMRARRVMVDFHVCAAPVPQHYLSVLASVFNRALRNGYFDEVVLIE